MSLIYCQCYSGNIRLTCSKCHLIFNTNSGKITEQDSKQVILEKLKKELQSKQVDVTCLKMEIRDLELEIANQEKDAINEISQMKNASGTEKKQLAISFMNKLLASSNIPEQEKQLLEMFIPLLVNDIDVIEKDVKGCFSWLKRKV